MGDGNYVKYSLLLGVSHSYESDGIYHFALIDAHLCHPYHYHPSFSGKLWDVVIMPPIRCERCLGKWPRCSVR